MNSHRHNSDDFWFDVGSLQEIPVRGARRVKTPRREIAIFRTASDEVFALENRCPHKGGPAERRHRARPQGGVSAAQLDHQSRGRRGDRRRQGLRAKLSGQTRERSRLSRHERRRGRSRSFCIDAAASELQHFHSTSKFQRNSDGLSRTFRIRDQDGRCRRSQDLHVHPRHGGPRLHGRRAAVARCRLRGDGHGADRLSDHRRDAVSGRLLHAVSARLRSSDRRVRAVPAGADRQASRRDARRRAAQLGSGVRRQLRRRLHRRADDGRRLHLRLLLAARQGRPGDRRHRRRPHGRLRRARLRPAC